MPDRAPAWRVATAALVAVLALALTACDSAEPGSSSPVAAVSPSPTASARPADATLAPLAVDPKLLAVLPASVGGVAMQPAPDAAARMITDPSLGQAAAAIAVGVVAAPGGSKGDDFASSTVVRLRPGVYTDDFYTGWRNAYDAAACAVAGGVSSHIREFIGRHEVELTVCGQGARTYHTRVGNDILVSITAIGDRAFGGLVMAGLRQ